MKERKKTFKKVKKWLDKMKLKYAESKFEDEYALPFDIEGTQFLVRVFVLEKWVKVAALVVPAEFVPEGLHKALLKANWDLFDVTYSVDEDGNIFSENDIPSTSNYENFESEFNAVIAGVLYFFGAVAKEFSVSRRDTYDKKTVSVYS